MYNQSSPGLFLVPFESGKYRIVQFIVGLSSLLAFFEVTKISSTHFLLVLFVDGVQCILDCDALEVPRSDFETEGEMQVNLLDWWSGEKLLQRFLFVQRCR